MTAAENKRILQQVFARTAEGDGRLFIESLAEDVNWRIIGSTGWSRKYAGKAEVLMDLLGPLNKQLDGRNTIIASHFVAENDTVVVQGKGSNRTKTGKAYENEYCWVIRMREGKMTEITEYADTQLIESVLQAPPQAGSPA